MKKKLTLISFCIIILSKLYAQNAQNIELKFTKPSKLLITENLNLWKYGSKGAGSITTHELSVSLTKPEPFIAFSIALEGSRIDASLVEISLLTKQEGMWAKDWLPVEHNSDADNTSLRMVTNMCELDKNTTALKVRFIIKSNDIRLKKAKLRLFAPGSISTGDIQSPLQLRGDCQQAPPSVSRSVWGAQWNLTDDKIYKGSPAYTPVTHLIVHHSAGNNTGSNWAAVVAAYFDLHVNTNGWSDIGYNWLIAPDGTLFVGRGGGDGVVGAHMCGYNANTMGVCMIGNFTTVEPSQSALNKLAQLLAAKAMKFAIDPLGISAIRSNTGTMNNISGHRDGCARDYTECPGNLLYPKLTALRKDVKTTLAGCTTSNGDLWVQDNLKIYPNPNHGQFQLTADIRELTSQPKVIRVINIEGKVIFEKKIDAHLTTINETIELSNSAKGIYLVQLSSDKKSSTRLISIN